MTSHYPPGTYPPPPKPRDIGKIPDIVCDVQVFWMSPVSGPAFTTFERISSVRRFDHDYHLIKEDGSGSISIPYRAVRFLHKKSLNN